MPSLLNNTLLQILSKIHLANIGSSIFGCNLCDIMSHHNVDELLEGCLGWIPTEDFFCFGWITPEVYYVRWAVEIGADTNKGFAD